MSYSARIERRYIPTSQSHAAPPHMGHPHAGDFELMGAAVNEFHSGPMRGKGHAHAIYHLVLFTEGDNHFLLNGSAVASKRGLCVFTRPNNPHSFMPRDPGGSTYHAVNFRFAEMQNPPEWGDLMMHWTGLHMRPVPNTYELPEQVMVRIPAIMAGIAAALPPHSALRSARLHHAILGLFLLLAEALAATSEDQRQTVPEQQARGLIEQHYASGISLTELAKRIGVTPAHLGRRFRAAYGTSPARYRDTLRVEAATNLLRHSDLLVKQIGYDLSYPDAYTFSKAYRRHTGHSPSAERG